MVKLKKYTTCNNAIYYVIIRLSCEQNNLIFVLCVINKRLILIHFILK